MKEDSDSVRTYRWARTCFRQMSPLKSVVMIPVLVRLSCRHCRGMPPAQAVPLPKPRRDISRYKPGPTTLPRSVPPKSAARCQDSRSSGARVPPEIRASQFSRGPVAASVGGSVDCYHPVFARQKRQGFELEVFDAAGIAMNHQHRWTPPGVNVVHAQALNRHKMIFNQWTMESSIVCGAPSWRFRGCRPACE